MRKLTTFMVALAVILMLSGNALAAGSLYKAGNIAIGGGYSGSSYNIGNTSSSGGFMIQGSYFITDVWAVGGQWYSNSLTGNGANITESILAINVSGHESFNDTFGYYASMGYGSATFTFPAPIAATSGGGFMVELGLEAKITPNITGFAGYRGVTPNNSAVTTGKYSNQGFNVGANIVF